MEESGMTNEEIRKEPCFDITKTDSYAVELLESDLNAIQNLTRKDERDKVISEIKKWLDENEYPNREGFGFFEIDTDDLYTKLTQLKEGI